MIKNIVPEENCDRVAAEMMDMLGWDANDPSTWCAAASLCSGVRWALGGHDRVRSGGAERPQ